jgi:hypothetical protein
MFESVCLFKDSVACAFNLITTFSNLFSEM